MLVRQRPWNDFDRMVSSFFGEWPQVTQESDGTPLWQPPVDVHEDGHSFVLMVDLPGVLDKDVDINIKDNVLTLHASRREDEVKDKEQTYTRRERFYGDFHRTFTLPTTVDAEKIGADLRNGVLTVTLPKRSEAQPRHIKVKASS